MPEPLVISTMRQFKAELLRQEAVQMRAMAARWLNVERRLQGRMDALALEMVQIKRDGGTVSREMLINQQRYRDLMAQVQVELRVYSDYAERTIEDRQRQMARLGIYHGEQAIRAGGIQAGFNRLPIEAVEHMVGFTGANTPLGQLIAGTWPAASDGITQALIDGVALGLNPRDTARNMARASTASLDRMMTIARTEQLRTYRTANLESYRASGVVSGYKRLAAHDRRTCAACIMSEGTFYDLNEDLMPTHPNCRCTLVPVVQGFPEPKWLGGQEWFEQQDQETQVSILGKERYYRWQNGNFDLGELVTVKRNVTWGDSLQVTPLKELV